MKQRVILIASIVVGLLAAVLTGQYLRAKDREYNAQLQMIRNRSRTVDVIVAGKALPVGTALTKDDVQVAKIAESAIRGHGVEEKDWLLLRGKALIRSLNAGDPIYWSDLEGGDPSNRGLASDIKRRQRAISISVGGAAAVSGMVKPNDHVDVLGTFTFPSSGKGGDMEMVTLTLLQDVLVLATGRETAKNQILAGDRAAGGYSTVTVEVTPREAEMLVFAEQARGRLVLTLRNPADLDYLLDLPRVDFAKIQEEITTLNRFRQEKLLGKPVP
jgi:pilus assembly protein CpaB